jgi:O-antigen ligase
MIQNLSTATPNGPLPAGRAERLLSAGLMLFAFTCTFSISASQISLGLTFIAATILFWQGKFCIRSSSIDKPFAFLVLTGFLSAFQAEVPTKALIEMKSFLVIMAFYLPFWAKLETSFKQRLLYLFIFSAALVSLVNNFQILSGLAEAKHTRGFFSMSITFGECMALAGLTALTCMATGRTRTGKLLILGALCLIAVSLLQSLTRGAWLGFIGGSLILLVRFPRTLLPWFLVFSLIAGTMAWYNPYLRERLTGFNLNKTVEAASKPLSPDQESIALYSNLQRLYIWMRGFIMLNGNPPFGVGQRHVKIHYKRLASKTELDNNLIWGHQHNNFMQMLAMNGLLGLIAFVYLVVECCRMLLTQATMASGIEKGAIAILAGFIIFGMTEY